MAIVDELNELNAQALRDIEAAASRRRSKRFGVAVLGKKGTLTGYLRGMGQLPKEERAEVGKTANIVRNAVESALANRKGSACEGGAALRRWMRKPWTSRFPAAASRLERA